MGLQTLVLFLGLVTLVAKQGLGAVSTRTPSPSVSLHASAVEKPGQCPLGWQAHVPASRVYCFSDASCPGSEKCCSMGALRICAQPALVGPGYCPKHCAATEEPCLVSCLDDTWCGPGEKCCSSDCHSRCVVAEPARPGVCPRKRVLWSGTPCANQCDDDRSCPEGQKCCFSGCGLECVNPSREELPQCTEASHTTAQKTCTDQCMEDADCPRNKKCSLTNCGFQCKGLPTVKPGACPLQLRGSLGPCPGPVLQNCSGDFDCEAAKKCCSIGCNHVCKEPEEVRPGACPPRASENGALECAPTFCAKDRDCPQPNEKCCRLRCGWVCMAPVTSSSQQWAPGVTVIAQSYACLLRRIPAIEHLQKKMEKPREPEKTSGSTTMFTKFLGNKAHE